MWASSDQRAEFKVAAISATLGLPPLRRPHDPIDVCAAQSRRNRDAIAVRCHMTLG
jgi:hypothetical protein